MELIINGRYDEAFSHLLLFGLASILEDADDSRICTIRWIDRTHAGIDVSDNLSWEDCATVIRDHAHRWSMSSWLNASDVYSVPVKSGKSSKNAVSAARATLSPRLGTLSLIHI